MIETCAVFWLAGWGGLVAAGPESYRPVASCGNGLGALEKPLLDLSNLMIPRRILIPFCLH